MIEEPSARMFYHLLSTVSTLLSFFWMWMILNHSPKEMKDFKWLLVKLALREELFAIFLGAVLACDPLFPAPGAAVLGLGYYFGQPGAHFGMAGAFFFGMSIFFSINNCVRIRGMVLNGQEHIVRACAKPYIGIPITMGLKVLMGAPLITSMYLALEEPQQFIDRMIAIGNYQYIEFYAVQNDTVWLSVDISSTWGNIFIMTLILGLLLMYLVNVVASLQLLHGLRTHQALMSKSIYKAHISIFYMLASQNIYPIFVLVLPVSFTAFSLARNNHAILASNVYKHYMASGLIIYPAMSCIVSILIMKPYRDYVRKHIFRIEDPVLTVEPTLNSGAQRLA